MGAGGGAVTLRSPAALPCLDLCSPCWDHLRGECQLLEAWLCMEREQEEAAACEGWGMGGAGGEGMGMGMEFWGEVSASANLLL